MRNGVRAEAFRVCHVVQRDRIAASINVLADAVRIRGGGQPVQVAKVVRAYEAERSRRAIKYFHEIDAVRRQGRGVGVRESSGISMGPKIPHRGRARRKAKVTPV